MLIDNFFDFFIEHYNRSPDKNSLVFDPENKESKIFTFKDIYKRVASLQEQLKGVGVSKGSKVVLLAELNENFYFTALAVIASGATPVFLEPKKERLLRRLSSTDFDFILLDPKICFLKYILPSLWLKKTFSFGKKKLGTLKLTETSSEKKIHIEKMAPEDPLLISFTTGSTGEQKAADRNYSVSYSQHIVSMKHWLHTDKDVDLTFFPNILFQNLSSGVTTLVPNMRVKDLSAFPFEKVSQIIKDYKVTRLSIPPGYLNALHEHSPKPIETVEKVICGGAAVDPILAQKTLELFPNADCNVVYGSTEAEPISSFNMKHLIGSSEINVGVPVEDISVKIDAENSSDRGEVLISGPHVVKRYLNNSIDNSVFKLTDENGKVWHRTGDIGAFNLKGELVLSGRKKHAFKTEKGLRYNLEMESLISCQLPKKSRCALLKSGDNIILGLETKNLSAHDQKLTQDKAAEVLNSYFKKYKIHFFETLPVDSRHHWKIEYSKILP